MYYFQPVWAIREKSAGQPPAGGQPKVPNYKVVTRQEHGGRTTSHRSTDDLYDGGINVHSRPHGGGLWQQVAIFGHHTLGGGHAVMNIGVDGTTEIKSAGRSTPNVKPASPELKAMIAAHHDNHAWMPLLDKISEEYEGTPIAEAAARHMAYRQFGHRMKGMGGGMSPHLALALSHAGVPWTKEREQVWHDGGHEERAVKAAAKSPAAYKKVIAEAPSIFPGGRQSLTPIKLTSGKKSKAAPAEPIDLADDQYSATEPQTAVPAPQKRLRSGLVELPPEERTAPARSEEPKQPDRWRVQSQRDPSIHTTVHTSPDGDHQLRVVTTRTAIGPKHAVWLVRRVLGEPSAGHQIALTVTRHGGVRFHRGLNDHGEVVRGVNPYQHETPDGVGQPPVADPPAVEAPPPGYRQPKAKGSPAVDADAPRVASAKLRQLLESHHDAPDWHPLIRQLVREFPQQMGAAVREHMQARGVRLKGMDDLFADVGEWREKSAGGSPAGGGLEPPVFKIHRDSHKIAGFNIQNTTHRPDGVASHGMNVRTSDVAGHNTEHEIAFQRHDGSLDTSLWVHHDGHTSMHEYANGITHRVTTVKPASPELKALIAAHHDNHAWMPLLDKIQEEYEGTPIAEAAQRHAAYRNFGHRMKGMGDLLDYPDVVDVREKAMGGGSPPTPQQPPASAKPATPQPSWKFGTTHDRAWAHSWHTSPTSEHALHVWHTHGDGADDLTVELKQPPTPAQKRRGVANHTVAFHHDRPNGEAWVVSGEPWLQPQEGVRVAEPSPELQTMIENHHDDPSNTWYPLLDKLVEEYPEHFHKPVMEHVEARNGIQKPKPARRTPAQLPRPTA